MTVTARNCPVCDSPSVDAPVFLEASIDPGRISEYSFSSRKVPEFMSHRLVTCPHCQLVYVPTPPAQDTLAVAYHEAAYDSAQEAEDAARSYAEAIEPILQKLGQRGAALEIGTGSGVFLERLADAGFGELVGVEPSLAAIRAATPRRRAWIREGIFDEQQFQPASFDLVCCFMTMEHVAEPGKLAASALRLLRPGGAFVTVTHDYRSPVNRLLGRRSPIIDIEHMQLFSTNSVQELYRRAGFADVSVKAFANRYRLGYWLRLTPLPAPVKRALDTLLRRTGLAQARLAFNVGNSIAAGFRPAQPGQ
jgi:SAM-dependent methyltransferase